MNRPPLKWIEDQIELWEDILASDTLKSETGVAQVTGILLGLRMAAVIIASDQLDKAPK